MSTEPKAIVDWPKLMPEEEARRGAELEEMAAADEAEAERYLLAARQAIAEGHEMLCRLAAGYPFIDADVDSAARHAACDEHQGFLDRRRKALPPKPKGHRPRKDEAYRRYYEDYRQATKGKGQAVVNRCAADLKVSVGAVRKAFHNLKDPDRTPAGWPW